MIRIFRKSAAALALLASVSMAASPALARDRWGRHHDDIDAGDVITGILIIGGIAAIASAASSDDKRRRDRERREREEREARDYRYEGQDDSRGYGQSDERPEWHEGGTRYDSGTSTGVGGINAAIERCTSEIERGRAQVAEVETVGKQGDGWRVEGRTAGGEAFACTIDRDGRIRSATVGGGAY
jgi:hypothetical protein